MPPGLPLSALRNATKMWLPVPLKWQSDDVLVSPSPPASSEFATSSLRSQVRFMTALDQEHPPKVRRRVGLSREDGK